jgi:SAM-dependent methyltransferase
MTSDWSARADRLSAEAFAAGEPTAWFERLYAAGVAGEVSMPWDRTDPHPLLRDWVDAAALDGRGKRAVVVGSGLGADAEFLSRLGFSTTGIDISATAVAQARLRNPETAVDYRVADLLDLPDDLPGGFDLVVEIYTLQAVPDPPRSRMVPAVAGLVAPAGTLLAVAFRYDGTTALDDGPPFPLTRELMEGLGGDGLGVVRLEELAGPLWRVEYRRG